MYAYQVTLPCGRHVRQLLVVLHTAPRTTSLATRTFTPRHYHSVKDGVPASCHQVLFTSRTDRFSNCCSSHRISATLDVGLTLLDPLRLRPTRPTYPNPTGLHFGSTVLLQRCTTDFPRGVEHFLSPLRSYSTLTRTLTPLLPLHFSSRVTPPSHTPFVTSHVHLSCPPGGQPPIMDAVAAGTDEGGGGRLRLFEEESHAASYAKYRPTYPSLLYQTILSYCHQETDYLPRMALDVACGSGQSTSALTQHFTSVLGTDISQAQIEAARRSAAQQDGRLEYRVGSAETLTGVKDESVDLVTCAQALHWLDREKFYGEVRRVLRPGGVLAVYGYGRAYLDEPTASHIFQEFYTETLSSYWAPERGLVNTRLRDITLPFSNFTRDDSLEIPLRMPLDSFVGYMTSSSAYRRYIKENPDSGILLDIKDQILSAYRQHSPESVTDGVLWLKVTWPIYLLMGRKDTGQAAKPSS